MAKSRIICTKKDASGTITHYGVLIPREEAARLVDGGWELYTLFDGKLERVVAVHQNNKPHYLRTPADDTEENNIGKLPACTCGSASHPFDDFLSGTTSE
ncbi:DUF3892 domain-containing protein [Sorangium sp. So ce1097]|uniref:DUF3892 domain-containing protein n=1 Tax=Sorangium sp. So ce1097 TaxID=3133330 RepID=UPI003F600A38